MKDKNILFQDKLSNEFEKYIKNLLSKDKKYIIDHSYETIIKEAIIDFFNYSYDDEYDNLDILLSIKNPLEYFYQIWLKDDSNIKQLLEDGITFEISKIKNHIRKLENKINNNYIKENIR